MSFLELRGTPSMQKQKMDMFLSPIEYRNFDWRNASTAPILCYSYSMIATGTIWKGQNPIDFTYPLFLLEILVIILTTRATAALCRPLHQPRYLADLLGGILLGPTVMGMIPNFSIHVFPLRSIIVLETVAYIGLLYFIFIIAIEIDLSVVHQHKGRSASFAAVCTILPFAIAATSGLVVHGGGASKSAFIGFLGVSLSVTAFSVLARTLAELKLLHTTLGSLALSAAMLIDAWVWGLLAMTIALGQDTLHMWATLWSTLSGAALGGCFLAVVRPAVVWVAAQTAEGEEVDEVYTLVILVGVLVAGVVADVIGISAVTGAFLFGLMIPNGPLGVALIERVEDFVQGLLLPLFFAVSGLKTNLFAVIEAEGAMLLVTVVILAAVAKVVACVLVGCLFKMSLRDGLSIGLLLNTKGIIEVVMLNIGRDKRVFDESSFSVLVLMSMVVTAMVSPLLKLVVKPASRRLAPYQRRTVQWPKPDAELRILVCLHGTRNVPTMIGLVEASNPTKRSPILVLPLHLIELSGRASAMLVIHNSKSSSQPRRLSDHIMHAFETYEQHAGGVSVQALTAVSPYPTMHLDVCSVAEDKRAALIILPFHKQQTIDGEMEVTNPAVRTLNQNVLDAAPCSVGVIVDRGLGGTSRIASGRHAAHHAACVFLGGPDDREALCYASRMSDHPGISLTVVRLIPAAHLQDPGQRVLSVGADWERRLDDECVGELRVRRAGDESLLYMERAVGNAEDTLAAIRSMDSIHDLYIVGRGRGVESPVTKGMNDWSECPELGPIGDLLASSDFTGMASVLVVQRCTAAGSGVAPVWTHDNPKLKVSASKADSQTATRVVRGGLPPRSRQP